MGDKKRKQFTLEDKVKIINEVNAGKKKIDVAKEFDIHRSTLNTIWNDRTKIQGKLHDKTMGPLRKKMRPALYEDVEKALFIWFQDVRSRNIPISGPTVQQKAKDLAELLHHENFTASDGWLHRFRNRFGISAKAICGESASVPIETVNLWRTGEIRKLIAAYSEDDIFNADETGMFYQLLPHRTLAAKNDPCKGGKKSKERLTVHFCCNASGTEKLKPWVIGKSLNPRCFKNVKSLPCEYRANKRAWMTHNIFEEWLLDIEKKMKLEKRKILLLVDNCAAHIAIPRMDNVRVEFFPPNCTSVLQPLDLGIIQTVKVHYRKLLLKKVLLLLEQPDNMKTGLKVDVKQAIDMIAASWLSVAASVINKCWKKTGIMSAETSEIRVCDEEMTESDFIDDGFRDLWNKVVSLSDVPEGTTVEDFIAADDDLPVTSELTDAEIAASVMGSIPAEDESDDDQTGDVEAERPRRTISEAITSIEILRDYLSSCTDVPDHYFHNVSQLEEYLLTSASQNLRQKKITYFFMNK